MSEIKTHKVAIMTHDVDADWVKEMVELKDHQAALQQARIDVVMECLNLVKSEMPGVPNPPDDPPNGFMEYCEGIHACHARIEKHIEQLKEQEE